MAAPKQAARKPRRRDRKSVPVGQAHIKSTFNNTIISITDPSGAVVSWASGGDVGFKGFLRTSAAYTEDVGECDLDALVIGDVDSGKTCHCDSFCLPQVSHPIPRYPYRPGPAFPGFSSRIHANCD